MKRPIDTSRLLSEHPALWRDATRHPFLDGVRDGSLPTKALDTWLAQDALFVERLSRFQARVLARAPGGDLLALAQGLVALAEELRWFEAIAAERGLDPATPIQSSCRAYTDYLLQLGEDAAVPYVALITAVWTVERAYLDAWIGARPGAPAFRAFVAHWTVDAFAAYVAELAAAADRALAACDVPEAESALAVFRSVAAHERAFWQMAFAAPPA